MGRGSACGVRTKNFESRSCRRNTSNKLGSQLDMTVHDTDCNVRQQGRSLHTARLMVAQLHILSVFADILDV